MTMELELKKLVEVYAKYDTEKGGYVSRLDKSALLKLDADFIKLLNQQLLADGASEEHLTKNYKRITLYLHPDKSSSFLPTVTWLEHNLSEGRNDGVCFKTLKTCYDKLINPQKFKEISFENIKSRADCRQWLESLRNNAGSYTSRSFCDSLIGLLDESGGFYDELGKIKPKGIKTLLTFMPIIFASYGTIIFAQELFAVYALYFLMLKGGQYLERNDAIEMRQLGQTFQEISTIAATATTTLVIRLLEMTFWISHQFLDVGLQIGAALFNSLLPTSTQHSHVNNENAIENLCRDLILTSQNFSEGMQFNTPELKVIAAPLEAYKSLNEQQFFRSLRLGWTKGLKVDDFLFKMRVLDKGSQPVTEKIAIAHNALEELKKNKDVYTEGGNTAKAIDTAQHIITLLREREPSSMQLAVYNGERGHEGQETLDDRSESESRSMLL